MTDFGLSVARRYRVGITSVLRRCAAVFGFMVCSVSMPHADERPSSDAFVNALDNCVRFYEQHRIEVFSGWEVVKPMHRSCDDCSTLSGQVRHPNSNLSIDVELTDRGSFAGVGCRSNRSVGPALSADLDRSVAQWLEAQEVAGRLVAIPEEKRRLPREAFKSCFRPDRPLGVLIAPTRSEAFFTTMPGKPTGMNDPVSPCVPPAEVS